MGTKEKTEKKRRITRMQQKYPRMRRENSTIADLFAHNLCCGLQNVVSAMFFKSFHTRFLGNCFSVYFYSLLFGPKVCFKEYFNTFCINILQLYLLFERDFSPIRLCCLLLFPTMQTILMQVSICSRKPG